MHFQAEQELGQSPEGRKAGWMHRGWGAEVLTEGALGMVSSGRWTRWPPIQDWGIRWTSGPSTHHSPVLLGRSGCEICWPNFSPIVLSDHKTLPLTQGPWPGQQSPCTWPPSMCSWCETLPSPRWEILQSPPHLPCLAGG